MLTNTHPNARITPTPYCIDERQRGALTIREVRERLENVPEEAQDLLFYAVDNATGDNFPVYDVRLCADDEGHHYTNPLAAVWTSDPDDGIRSLPRHATADTFEVTLSVRGPQGEPVAVLEVGPFGSYDDAFHFANTAQGEKARTVARLAGALRGHPAQEVLRPDMSMYSPEVRQYIAGATIAGYDSAAGETVFESDTH